MIEAQDARLRTMLHGYRRTQVLSLMVRLGLVDALATGPLTDEELAVECGAAREPLSALLRVLAAEDLVIATDERTYELTPLGARLDTTSDSGLWPWAELVGAEFYQAWGAGLEAIRTGRNGFEAAYGTPMWQHMAEHGDAARAFDAAMVATATPGLPAIADDEEFERCTTMVDVGGGTGSVLAAVLSAHPQLKGILFDQSPAVDDANSPLSAAGVQDRYVTLEGDFLDAVPEGADLYLLCRILCDWRDDQAIRILSNCRAAMDEQSRLLIVARLLADSESSGNPMFDLHMWMLLGSRDRTRAEYRRLLAEAGLAERSLRPVEGTDLTLITAVPA